MAPVLPFPLSGHFETSLHYSQNIATNLSEQALYYEEKANWDAADSYEDGYDVLDVATNMASGGFIIPYESQWDYNPSYCQVDDTDQNGNSLPDNLSNSCTFNAVNGSDSGWCSSYYLTAAQKASMGTFYPEYCSNNASQGQYVCDESTPGKCGYLSYVNQGSHGMSLAQGQYISIAGNDQSNSGVLSNVDLQEAITYLNEGVPVVTEIAVTTDPNNPPQAGDPPSFETTTTGIVADPTASTATSGSHAILIVGFIPFSAMNGMNFPVTDSSIPASANGIFILKNSWGMGAGDAGFYYVSSTYLETEGMELVAFDAPTYYP